MSNLPDPKRPLKLDTVFPLQVWLQDQPWNRFWVRWFLAYALLPLAATSLINQGSADLRFASWFFGLYFAILWLMVLYASINPGKLDYVVITQIACFTIFVGIFLVLLIQSIPPFNILYAIINSESLIPRMLGFVLGVGVLEECIKLCPVYLFVFRANKPTSLLMFAFMGAVSGIAFGVAEAISYSIQYARGLVQGELTFGGYVIVQLLRLITLPLLHACWSAMFAYFLGLSFYHRHLTPRLLFFGLCLVICLHGLYNTFGGWISLGIAGLSLILFVSYIRTSNLISRELQANYQQPLP